MLEAFCLPEFQEAHQARNKAPTLNHTTQLRSPEPSTLSLQVAAQEVKAALEAHGELAEALETLPTTWALEFRVLGGFVMPRVLPLRLPSFTIRRVRERERDMVSQHCRFSASGELLEARHCNKTFHTL